MLDLEDELALAQGITALNGVLKGLKIREVCPGDHVYTVLLQYLNRERKKTEPRRPVGRPRNDAEPKRPVGRPRGRTTERSTGIRYILVDGEYVPEIS
jgi:hypothetical protein